MRSIRSTSMRPELIVRSLVHGLGFRFRLHRYDLPGRPDLVFSSQRKIIQVHGCFWHQHAGCRRSHIPNSKLDYWLPKLERNKRRDDEHLAQLNSLGWSVLIVWECELKRLEEVTAKISEFLSTVPAQVPKIEEGRGILEPGRKEHLMDLADGLRDSENRWSRKSGLA